MALVWYLYATCTTHVWHLYDGCMIHVRSDLEHSTVGWLRNASLKVSLLTVFFTRCYLLSVVPMRFDMCSPLVCDGRYSLCRLGARRSREHGAWQGRFTSEVHVCVIAMALICTLLHDATPCRLSVSRMSPGSEILDALVDVLPIARLCEAQLLVRSNRMKARQHLIGPLGDRAQPSLEFGIHVERIPGNSRRQLHPLHVPWASDAAWSVTSHSHCCLWRACCCEAQWQSPNGNVCLTLVRTSPCKEARRPAPSLVGALPSTPFPALGTLPHLLLSSRGWTRMPPFVGTH